MYNKNNEDKLLEAIATKQLEAGSIPATSTKIMNFKILFPSQEKMDEYWKEVDPRGQQYVRLQLITEPEPSIWLIGFSNEKVLELWQLSRPFGGKLI